MSAKRNRPGWSARAANGSERGVERSSRRRPALRAEGWRGLFRRSGGVARLTALALVLCLLPLLVLLLFHQDVAVQAAQLALPRVPFANNGSSIQADTCFDTSTPTPTPIPCPTATNTPTNTPAPPTNTPLPPTDTATFTATATDTATA